MACELCTARYDLAEREPRALNCGHTMCKECLERMFRASGGTGVRCPWDRIEDSRGLLEIPRNRALAESLLLDVQAAALGHGLDLPARFWLDERELELSDTHLGDGATSNVVAGSYQERPVAVKLISLGEAREAELQNLRRELAAVLMVTGECHRACQYKGATIKNNKFCLVMKKYPKSLARVIAEEGGAGGMPEAKVLLYAKQILAALVELHAHNIIVVDLKPANLLMNTLVNEIVVSDYGLSRCLDRTLGGYRPSSMQGTPNYMSPELYEHDDVSNSTDMWSWACVVLHMATGQVPFAGWPLTRIMRAVCNPNYTLEIPERLPAYLKSLLRTCLSHNQDGRPTATEALRAMTSQLGVSAAPAPAAPAPAAPAPAAPAPAARGPAAPATAARGPAAPATAAPAPAARGPAAPAPAARGPAAPATAARGPAAPATAAHGPAAPAPAARRPEAPAPAAPAIAARGPAAPATAARGPAAPAPAAPLSIQVPPPPSGDNLLGSFPPTCPFVDDRDSPYSDDGYYTPFFTRGVYYAFG